MTNEERCKCTYNETGCSDCEWTRLIQENAKLKAEINRSNGKSEMYRGIADDFCNSNIKLKAEIEQLKSELEQYQEPARFTDLSFEQALKGQV